MSLSQVIAFTSSLCKFVSPSFYAALNLRSWSVNDQPYVATILLALGTVTAARVFYQTVSVLAQTFILPGTNVSDRLRPSLQAVF